jgi:hypothetical protein
VGYRCRLGLTGGVLTAVKKIEANDHGRSYLYFLQYIFYKCLEDILNTRTYIIVDI